MTTKAVDKKSSPDQKKVETKAERTALTERLLANARKSPIELAEETGLTPEEAVSRLAALLEDRGWMTERMEERLLIIELGDMIQDARKVLKRAEYDPENYANVANVVLKGFAQMAQRFDQRRKLVDADLERVTAAYARKMVEIVQEGAMATINDLMDLHPDIDRDYAEAKLRDNILAISRRIDQEEK